MPHLKQFMLHVAVLSALLLAMLPSLLFAAAEKKETATDAAKPVAKPETKPEDKADSPEVADVAAGHSYHGEAFNQGPRQAAYPMAGMPNVTFPATCKTAVVQNYINQGVGQLHGFWYFEAERSFRQAAALDPDCAIAYWGMAMANGSNTKRSKPFIAEAMKRKDKCTDREKMYIDALNAYVNAPTSPSKKDKERREKLLAAMQSIIKAYPDDLEAKAFWAVYRWSSKSRISIKSDKDYKAVDDVIQQVLDKNPMHPCHHYRIHLWDYKDAKKALASSALAGQSSPGIAHMWHMPGHIFSRLNRFNDAAWQQEASARVDHAHMMRDRVLPDQIHNFAHNNEWLCRNLMNVGRVNDAIELAMNMTELPRHPKYNTLSKRGGSASHGRRRLFEALEKFELWDRMITLMDQGYLEATDVEREQIKQMRLLGIAAYETDQPARAEPIINDLQSRLAKLQAEQDAAGTKAYDETLKKAQADAAKKKADGEKAAKERAVKEKAEKEQAAKEQAKKEQAAKERSALEKAAAEKAKAALEASKVKSADPARATAEKGLRRAIAAREEAEKKNAPKAPETKKTETKKSEPKKTEAKKPAPEKPAKIKTPEEIATKAKTDARRKFDSRVNELSHALADIAAYQALARGDKEEARKQITKAGSVGNYRKSRFYGRLGDWKKAEEYAKKEVDSRKHRVQPLADYVYALFKAGKKDEAKTKLEELRQMSSNIEMASPVFTRINEVANAFGIEGDWRIKKPLAKDIGERPDLDTLGPFRWQPTPAPDWKLQTTDGSRVSLSDYRGKNVIVIFYLGADCIHCTEQLAAFAPKAKEFKQAGIELVGISTDDVLNLKRSLKPVESEGGYAFPLVSNAGLDVFRKYRCYDDFEKLTLHGTFLIDGNGLVRWQDISYEPYTDVKFLLEEAQRLLKQNHSKAVVTR